MLGVRGPCLTPNVDGVDTQLCNDGLVFFGFFDGNNLSSGHRDLLFGRGL